MPMPIAMLRAASPVLKPILQPTLRAFGLVGGTGGPRRRRRSRYLTAREREELLWIKTHVGKTAAGEYLARRSR